MAACHVLCVSRTVSNWDWLSMCTSPAGLSFNVNFRLLKTIYVHLLVCCLNKLQNARCNDKDNFSFFVTIHNSFLLVVSESYVLVTFQNSTHVHMNFFLTRTDTFTSQNTDLSSWITMHNLMFIGPCIIAIVDEWKTSLMWLAILFHLLCTQHVSDINISIFRSLRLCWWVTTSVIRPRCIGAEGPRTQLII